MVYIGLPNIKLPQGKPLFLPTKDLKCISQLSRDVQETRIKLPVRAQLSIPDQNTAIAIAGRRQPSAPSCLSSQQEALDRKQSHLRIQLLNWLVVSHGAGCLLGVHAAEKISLDL